MKPSPFNGCSCIIGTSSWASKRARPSRGVRRDERRPSRNKGQNSVWDVSGTREATFPRGGSRRESSCNTDMNVTEGPGGRGLVDVRTVLPSKSSIAPAAEVVASFIEVHEQGRKLGRDNDGRKLEVHRSRSVPMVSTARAAVGLSRGSKLTTARARSASSKHLRPVRARRRAACRGQHRFVEGVSVVPNS